MLFILVITDDAQQRHDGQDPRAGTVRSDR